MIDTFLDFYVRGFAVALPGFFLLLTMFAAQTAGVSRGQTGKAVLVLAALFGVWYAGTAELAERDILMPPATFTDPPVVMMFLLGGAAVVWALGALTPLGRRILAGADQTSFMAFQIPRMMGGVFLIGWLAGVIPWEFAIPAGLGDMWAGYAALQARRALQRQDARAGALVYRANVIGLLDFVVAVGTGVLTSEGFLHLLSKDAPNIINHAPMALFPAYFVPIFLAVHLFSIGHMRSNKTPHSIQTETM